MADSSNLLHQAQAKIDASMSTQTRVVLVSASEIEVKPISWLWPEWIACGKLTILAGAAGTGKTTLAMDLAATTTNAGRWPDGSACHEAGNVLIWSGEDDASDTLIPRLMACGADRSRVHVIQAVEDPKGRRLPFDPARDVSKLDAAMREIGGASLLIIDPIVSAVTGDMHRANDVRRSLQALVDLAERGCCAVLGITHFAKGAIGIAPQDRVIGSQAFAALARTVLVAAKQEDAETRVLARAKSNISLDDGGVSYVIEPQALADGLQTTRVVWGGRVEGTAREILSTVEYQGDGTGGALAEAEQFLRDLLSDGPVPTRDVKVESADAGHTWATIRRAQKRLGVKVQKQGTGIGDKSAWFWSMPP